MNFNKQGPGESNILAFPSDLPNHLLGVDMKQFLWLPFFLFTLGSFAQQPHYQVWQGLLDPVSDKPHYSMKNTGNGSNMLFTGLFIGYKKFISSQDGNSCSFTPSCSVYALQSIRQKGVLPGLLNAFDRLSRCNGLSPELYPVDPVSHLLYDPVQ